MAVASRRGGGVAGAGILAALVGGCASERMDLAASFEQALELCPASTEQDRIFDGELAARVDADLPDAIDTSGLSATRLGAIAFALELPYEQVLRQLDVGLALSRGPLGRVVVAALDDGHTALPALDEELLQRGFDRYYACVRGLPPTRAELVERHGDYRSATPEIVEDSSLKDGPRALYQLPDRGLFVAETTSDDGAETEVIVQGARPDGALEFLAYDSRGHLTTRVRMPKIDAGQALSAPFACLQCHRDIDDNRIDNVDPRTR